GGDWSDSGIVGVDRFVQRSYDIFQKFENVVINSPAPDKFSVQTLSEEEKSVYRKINQTIVKYDEEINNFRFNTAVAALMELVNELAKNLEKCRPNLQSYVLERFACLIAPVAPHMGEECWEMIGKKGSIFEQANWYSPDPDALTVDRVTVAVQVNGKLRATLEVPAENDQASVKALVFSADGVKKHIDGKTIVKEIYVKNKIYNIVVK
ncbi:MAG: class I tRNA ligase family protein, partial [Bacteroidota bacterium]